MYDVRNMRSGTTEEVLSHCSAQLVGGGEVFNSKKTNMPGVCRGVFIATCSPTHGSVDKTHVRWDVAGRPAGDDDLLTNERTTV